MALVLPAPRNGLSATAAGKAVTTAWTGDKLGQAEPASDLASFTSKVQHMGINKVLDDDRVLDAAARLDHLVHAEEICASFLAEYARHATQSPPRVALWEGLELFSLVLSAAKKMLRRRVDDCLFMLDRHLTAHGLCPVASLLTRRTGR